jgi:hypothetical protein
MAHEQGRQLWLCQPQAYPVAGDPRLAHLEERVADLVLVTDTYLVVGQPVDGEVLPELPMLEVIPPEELPPVLVRSELVHQDGAVGSAVPGKVALAVPLDVEPPDHPRPFDRPLPHAGVNRAPVPHDISRKPDVDGNEATHGGGGV